MLMQTRKFLAGKFLVGPLADERGGPVLEFAFLVMVLAFLGVGMFDFGRYGLLYTRAYNAARAGTQFGIQNQGTASNIVGMVAAARADAGVANDVLSVDARNFCMCPESTAEVGCGGTCADGGFVPFFVQVTVRDTVNLLFAYPGIGDPLQIASRSEMRVR